MKILIIDDERFIRNSLSDLVSVFGYDVETAEDGQQGLAMAVKEHYDAIFCDIKMPNMNGLEVLDGLREQGVDSAVIMISGHGDIDTAVECIKKGAFDFIQKPLQDMNRIQITLRNATERGSLIKETKVLKKKVYGQEMRSQRSGAPYIEVNCAAIPSELIESELFGHEKGSFTSAVKQHKGKFEQADGGTLFLDEIGDMSLAAQAKVLRVLQEKKLSRVGSDKDIDVDVRVIAATNKDLRKEIEEKRFREDLYHRLSVIVIKVPSLDERKSDIPLLVSYFIERICSETGMPRREVDADAMQLLVDKSWTGNIRELRNVVERLLILSGSRITADDVRAYVL